MTLREALLSARDRLRQDGIEEADLEAELLLRHVLGCDRAALFRRSTEPLVEAEAEAYTSLLARRLAGEPSAYLTGCREFYGLQLKVSPATLIPRPETEVLVEQAIRILTEPARHPREGRRVADVGTGSGAIAVALAREIPRASIWASDISEHALMVAQSNAERHGVLERISFVQSDLLEDLPDQLDLVAANLPYVSDTELVGLPREIRDFEPIAALAAGEDGLTLIRRLLEQAPGRLAPGGAICLEFGFGQAEAIRLLAEAAFPQADVECLDDLGGIPRVMVIRSRE